MEHQALARLIPVIEGLVEEKAAELEEHKRGRRHLDDPDFLWERLLVSMSTMGNSRGWHGLIGNEENHGLVTYHALAGLDPDQRLRRLTDVLRRAKVRMPDQKARWLAHNHDLIEALGGLEAVNDRFRSMTDRREILAFLQGFDGIGPKYARNIPMDVYHPAFRDAVAVDERIKKVSRALGLTFRSFAAHEAFYLGVAKGAGVEGWELDRLIYNFTDEVLSRLEETSAPVPPLEESPPNADAPREVTGVSSMPNTELFETVQRTFVETFPAVRAYTRKSGWFYGRARKVFFVALPRSRSEGVEVHLHVARHDLPDTRLELVEKPHSSRADPPVQHVLIQNATEVDEVMRLARFALRTWGEQTS